MRGGVGERDIAQIFKIEPPGMKENKEKKGSEKKRRKVGACHHCRVYLCAFTKEASVGMNGQRYRKPGQ